MEEVIFLAAAFAFYNYLVFYIIDTMLEYAELKKPFRILAGIVNTLVMIGVVQSEKSLGWAAYVLAGVLMLLEFILFYEDKFVRCLLCMLVCMLNVMAVKDICAIIFAVLTGYSMYEVTNNPALSMQSATVAVIVLNVIMLSIIRFVPVSQMKAVMKNKELSWLMSAWLFTFCLYFLINAEVDGISFTHPILMRYQIAAPATILVGSYIILFFTIKVGSLLWYKEKSEELQAIVKKEQQYRRFLEKDVYMTIEVNFSRNEIISGLDDYEEKLEGGIKGRSYSDLLFIMTGRFVHPEDVNEFLKYSSPSMITAEFENGKTEIMFDYRRFVSDGKYEWVRLYMPLVRDSGSGEIKGYAQFKNIDVEKGQQLELQYKAERDPLTGLYNKGMTEKLITEYLNLDADETGTFYIIDIDNFKGVNDNLGHIYGDGVLSTLSENLRRVFREGDIVGRIGGDEFIVFMKGSSGNHIVSQKGAEVCKAFCRTYKDSHSRLHTVSASVGIAVAPKDGKSFEVLYEKADIALYDAKKSGKNNFMVYEGRDDK